jgi:hypothetical protein
LREDSESGRDPLDILDHSGDNISIRKIGRPSKA